MKAIRKLFKVTYPLYEPKSTRAFVKALDDSRIDSLRKLVSDSVENQLEFDEGFAISTFREILKIEKKSSYVKEIVGWATLPLDFIPLPGIAAPLARIGETVVNNLVEKKLREPKAWFYLVSDIASET
jgi:hypothetical protein